MGITIKSFIDWKGWGPGKGFVHSVSNGVPDYNTQWATRVPQGSRTRWVSAIPSSLARPHRDEWKTNISSIEWETVGPMWISMAQTILRTDSQFAYYRQSWFATSDGKWTQQFRNHSLWSRMSELLAAKMEKHFAYQRGFVSGVEAASFDETAAADSFAAEYQAVVDPRVPDDEANALGIGKWLVKAVVRTAAHPVGRLFIPQPGFVPTAAVGIGLFLWNRYGLVSESEVDDTSIGSDDLDFQADTLAGINIPLFDVGKDLGLFVMEHPSDPLFRLSKVVGAPNTLMALSSNRYA